MNNIDSTINLNLLMHPSWAIKLNSIKLNFEKIGIFLIKELKKGNIFLPDSKVILKTLRSNLDSVKVLILGQDPYPTPGYANGYAFAVNKNILSLPKSLINIYKELKNDLYDNYIPIDQNQDLSYWVKQGVMLLNRVLTVKSFKPKSHYGCGWEIITNKIISILIQRNKPLVGILWGQEAQKLKFLFKKYNIPTICSAHPSPLSAHKGFFGSKPFSRTNDLLKIQNTKSINW